MGQEESTPGGKKETQAQKRVVFLEFLDRKSGLMVCRNVVNRPATGLDQPVKDPAVVNAPDPAQQRGPVPASTLEVSC